MMNRTITKSPGHNASARNVHGNPLLPVTTETIVSIDFREAGMAGRTISAYVDETAAARVAALAEREDRPPAQIAGHAIRFYTSLSGDARNAIRTVEKAGSPEEMRWVM